MSGLLAFLVVMAVIQVAVSDGETPCGKVPPMENMNLVGKRRWYYCKSSGDTSDGGCFIDADPIGDGILTLTRTIYNSEKKEFETKSFNVSDSNDPPGPNAGQVDVAPISDKSCFLNLNCDGNDPPFFLFVCRTAEGCKGPQNDEFLAQEINKVKNMDGLGNVKTDMKDYYNPETCKEK